MVSQTSANYDMVDTEPELAACAAPLRELLEDSRPLGEYFDEANNLAVAHFRVHWWVVVLAATSGMLAVLFAMLQLEGERLLFLTADSIENLEVVAALLALACVLLGIWASFDRRWRLNRFLAEQCRFIKFDFLVRAGDWLQKPREDRQAHFQKQIAELASQHHEAPKDWVLRKIKFTSGDRPRFGALSPETLASLKEYYHAKRLSWQQGYFRKESHRRHRWEQLTRHIAPLCFFLSVSAACGHFVWELSHHQANRATDRPVARENDAAHPPRGPELGVVEAAPPGPKTVPTRAKHRPDNVSLGLLLAAACLPVFGAAWRTFRGANEFGRNTNRYIAMDAELSELGQKLEHAATPEDALECLWNIERAMDSEHRSWTRLMLEAEWFG